MAAGVCKAGELVQQPRQVGGLCDVVGVEMKGQVDGGQRRLHDGEQVCGGNCAALGEGGAHAQAQALIEHCSKVEQVGLG